MLSIRWYLLLIIGLSEITLYSMNVRRVVDWASAILRCPTNVHVYMNHSNILISDNKKAQTISTLGLRGCIVNIVYMKNEHMDQQIIMTHFHPNLLLEHGNELEKRLNRIVNKYNYVHNITIYPNGRSFFKKDSQDAAEAFKWRESQSLQDALGNSRKTCKALQSIVQKKLNVQQLDMSFVPYVLEPPIVNGIPLASEVHVTLSPTLNKPSLCQIRDAYDRKLYCDNMLNTKEPIFGRDELQRARLILVCPNDTE